MTVTLSRPYQGFPAGAVVDLSAELEAALVAQGLAVSGGTLSSGAQSTTATPISWQQMFGGVAVIAAAASSVVVSNPAITASSKAIAMINQAAADGTATSIVRCSCAAGALTISANAGATAAVRVAYLIWN